MNTLSILFSYDYVKNLLDLNWKDIRFAIDRGFFNPQATIEHAVDLLGKELEPSQLVLDLACLDKGKSNHPYMDELANHTPEQENSTSQSKFLYVILNWVYEHREHYADPLEVIEIIYADFDFPEEIAEFVRYMPTSEPGLGSLELSRERLFNKWKEYLEKQSVHYLMRLG